MNYHRLWISIFYIFISDLLVQSFCVSFGKFNFIAGLFLYLPPVESCVCSEACCYQTKMDQKVIPS